MADDKTACLLTNLPLEVRHNIFKYTAARHVKPKKLLRYWFEKKEIKDLIAQQAAADPNGPAPRVVHDNSYDEDSESEPIEDEDEDGQASGDDDAEEDAQEDEDGDGDGDEDEDEDGDENAEDLEDDTDQDEEDQDVEVDNEELDDATEEDEDVGSSATTQPPITTQPQPQPQPDDKDGQIDEAQMEGDNDEIQGSDDIQAEGEEAETQCAQEVDEDGHEAMAEENDEDGEDGEDVEHVGDNGGTAYPTAAAPPPPPPPPIVRAARKWRYIPNFMRITHCPPPVELLLASKQLNEEAKNWFYDVAILRIQATGSFAHTSFFEEAFSQITEAAFSPMENIRKVEITFAWDTTWLRADTIGWAEAIFPALLHQRSDFVYQILSQAPDLKDVTIHWHDSAQDDESANFMLDTLAAFHSLPANVKIQEHYIAADAKPHKRSIAGKRRLEFQNILDNGLDRLF